MKEDIIKILKSRSSINRKADAIQSLFAERFRDFAYHMMELEKKQGAKWVEKVKKDAAKEVPPVSEGLKS